MIKNSIQISRTAHYYSLGNDIDPSKILIALHGYGQKADDFLGAFTSSTKEDTLIIAPEAVSKFYNKKRETVSSWMTSLHREDEIKDYINYLNTLVKIILTNYSNINTINVLGYSQGCSTASRWVFNTTQSINHIFLCSGSCPPELKGKVNVKASLYFGMQDKILSIKKAKEEIDAYKKIFEVEKLILFEGGHIVSNECLADIIK
jgi:predicted esterase